MNRQPLISAEDAAAGRFIDRRFRKEYPIPGRLNVALAAIQLAAAFSLLTVASRSHKLIVMLSTAIGFAFVMQLGFCLAHETVHRKLHRNRHINLGVGVTLFALFPGSLHFFEVAHLLHHERNRSDDELEDYVLPGENAWVKRVMYFLLISGLFWMLVPLSSIAVALFPGKRIRLRPPADDSGVFRRFVQFLTQVRPNRVRRDVMVTLLIWAFAIPLLHLRALALLICYAAFGFSWASQQYIYHVRTPRHAVLGALDLELWTPLRWLYLNFNYHLTHHLAAWVPWTHLPRIAAHRPARGYLRTYTRLWRPPQLLEDAWPAAYQKSGPLPSRDKPRSSFAVELPW